MIMHIIYFLLAGFLIFAVNCENVPVIIWTNINDRDCKPEGSLKPEESSIRVVQSEYLHCLTKSQSTELHLVVAEKLSQNVFSNHQRQLEKFMLQLSDAPSYQVIPSVDATNIEQDLMMTFNDHMEVKVHRIPISSENIDQDLLAFDSKMAELFNEKVGKFVSILTGEQSLYESDESFNVQKRNKRQLLQAVATGDANKNYIDQSCVHMNFTSINVTIGTDQATLTYKSSSATCVPPKSNVSIVFTSNPSTIGDVTINMGFVSKFFPVSATNWWYLDSADISTTTQAAIALDISKLREVYTAPLTWSWTCHSPMVLKTPTKATTTAQVQFNILEIEIFNVTNGTQNNVFGNRVDCSGLLTPGIWMGTLVSLLLVIIFAFGMMGVMGLSTMDRFDSPKSKMIITHHKD